MSKKIGQKSGIKNQEIIKAFSNAPFSFREKKGLYSIRACFAIEGRKVEKELSMGRELDYEKLLKLWHLVDDIKAGLLPVSAFNGRNENQAHKSDSIKALSIGDAIALLKKEFWSNRSIENKKALTTWGGYLEVLEKIPLDGSIVSLEMLKELVINNSSPQTRKREKWVLVCARLGKIADIDTEAIKKLKGDRVLKKRYIPGDAEIEAARESIGDSEWRWVFSILAAYGLRPSELFHLDFELIESAGILKVGADTKTGEHICYPLHKQWLKDWDLKSVAYPQSLEKAMNNPNLTNQDKGNKISPKFKSAGLNFTPYALRDAYAIRGSVLGISPSIMSQWMGHSLTVHFKCYQRYLSQREWSQVWEKLD
jgi:hypothetical protein